MNIDLTLPRVPVLTPTSVSEIRYLDPTPRVVREVRMAVEGVPGVRVAIFVLHGVDLPGEVELLSSPTHFLSAHHEDHSDLTRAIAEAGRQVIAEHLAAPRVVAACREVDIDGKAVKS